MQRRLWLLVGLGAVAFVAAGAQVGAAGARPMVHPIDRAVQLPPPAPVHTALAETTKLTRADLARMAYDVDGRGLVAVVIDSGIRATHEDFKDWPGWPTKIVDRANFSTEADTNDLDGHGTNVSGIIAAHGVHTGIAPGASLVVVKVMGATHTYPLDRLDDALEWVFEERKALGIRVVNISSGHDNFTDDHHFVHDSKDEFIALWVRALRSEGVPVVCSAGNEYFELLSMHGMASPAIVAETISVGATFDADSGDIGFPDSRFPNDPRAVGAHAFSAVADAICPFSQRLPESDGGEWRTDVFAPGSTLTTTAGIADDHSGSDMWGTSASAPVVTGVILLMQQRYAREHGVYPSVDQIEQALRAGGKEITDGDDENDNVWNTGAKFRRVDAVGALEALGCKPEYSWVNLDRESAYAPASGPAVFKCKATLKMVRPSKLVILGSGSNERVSIRYFDSWSGGNDITAEVTHGGHATGFLEPGECVYFRLEATPLGELMATEDMDIRAPPMGWTRYGRGARATLRPPLLPCRPDLWFHDYQQHVYNVGDEVYSHTGDNQSVSGSGNAGGTLVYRFKVDNQGGSAWEPIVLSSTTCAGWQVRWYEGWESHSTEVTSDVTGSGLTIPNPGLGDAFGKKFQLEVTPSPALPDGATGTVLVTAKAANNSAAYDVARVTVTSLWPAVGDTFEPDDTHDTAKAQSADGKPVTHTFHCPGDVDWVRLQPSTGKAYILQAVSSEADPYLSPGGAPWIAWMPGTGGDGYFEVAPHGSGPTVGTYQVTITAFTPNTSTDTYENDPSAASARPIAVDAAPQQRTLHSGGDVDWAWFQAKAGVTYLAETVSDAPDTVLAVYKSDGKTKLAEDDDSGVHHASRLLWTCPADGKYYLVVSRGGVFCPGKYTLAIRSKDFGAAPDPYEPDDTAAQAVACPKAGPAQAHSLHTATDADWISFQALGGGIYKVEAGFLGAKPRVYVYGSAGTTMLADSGAPASGAQSASLTWVCPKAGTYYVKAADPGGGTGWYRLSVSRVCGEVAADRYEPDDTKWYARALPLNAAPQEHTISKPGDVDWVQVSMTAPVVVVEASAGAGDPCVAVWNQSGSAAGGDDDGGEQPFGARVVLERQGGSSYCIKITDSDSQHGTGSYTLRAYAAVYSGTGQTLTLPAGLSMVCLPVEPTQTDPALVMGFQNNGWARWNPQLGTTGGYVGYAKDPSRFTWFDRFHDLGKAYWAYLQEAKVLSLGGSPPAQDKAFQVELQAGWNMVGNPFLEDVAWDIYGIQVSDQAGGVWKRLVDRRDLSAWYSWRWANDPAKVGQYALVTAAGFVPEAESVWPTGRGLWVKALAHCYLQIPPPGASAAQSQGGQAAAPGTSARPLSQPPPSGPEGGWRLRLDATADDAPAGSLWLGVLGSQAAAVASDGFRAESPPAAPQAAGCQAAILGDDGGRYAVDLRPRSSTRQVWDLAVDAAAAAGRVTLAWPDLSRVPKDMRLTLTDLATGKRQYMRTTAAYAYEPRQGEGTRRFQVIAEPAKARALIVTALQAQPSGAGVMLAFTLSVGARTTIRVMNIAGREVAVLEADEVRAAGVNTRAWNAWGNQGRRLPSGAYLIELTARDDEGRQVSAVRSLTLRR